VFIYLFLLIVPPNFTTYFGYKTGIYLIVHNQGETPNTLDTAINIPTWVESYVAINKKLSSHLDNIQTVCLILKQTMLN
jgi:hypothetical protein